ncbi:DUF4304 domain-containing protein [Agromyces sp. NPDC127015]|uniref:DUF4304 domain-containing protein n=1 Tax=Agromyces sp. NPDC127015 TaxID=3347108 RepID=UPI00365D3FA9
MTAQDALKTALRDVLGPQARQHGYKGSAPTWRKSTLIGDWVVVNVQSSSWSNSTSLRCVVNISAAPEPWLRWQRHELGQKFPKAISESFGIYRQRLHPTGTPDGTDGWWEITDETSARDAVTDMVARLNDGGWALLDALLTREGMLSQIRDGDLGDMKREHSGVVYFARAEALLRMDDRPDDALDSCLTLALENVMPTQRENAERFDAWVRTQAQE